VKRRLLLVVGTLCLMLLGLGALSTGSPEVIKIGALFDYTGPVADLGPKFELGFRLALEEANYQVAGHEIEVIIEDSATSVATALEKFKKLVDQDGVKIVIGPLMGDAHVAIAPYAREKKVIVTSLINGMYEVAKEPGTTYLIYPTTCWAQTYWFGKWVYENLGYRKMALIYADYTGKYWYAHGAADGFEAAGGEVLERVPAPVGTMDYSPYISKLLAVADQIDVILYALEGPGPVSRFIYQSAQMGLVKPMVTITQDGDYTPEALAELGDIALGIMGEATYSWQINTPTNKAFVQKVMERTGKWPTSSEQNAYALTKIVLAGLEKTGGDDSFDKLWPAILNTQIITPAGPVYGFTPEGVAITPAYVTQAEVKDGEYVLSAPLYTEPWVYDPRLPSSQE